MLLTTLFENLEPGARKRKQIKNVLARTGRGRSQNGSAVRALECNLGFSLNGRGALETEDHEFLSNNAGSIYEVRNRREGTPYVYKVSTKGGVRSKAYKSEKYDSDGGEGSRISKLLRASYEYLALRRTSS